MLWLRAHLKEGNTVTPKRVNRGIVPWNSEMAKSHPENPHPQTMKSCTATRPTNWISTWNLSHLKLKMPARYRSLVMQDQPGWSANSFSYCSPRNDSSSLVRTKPSLPLHHFSYTCSHTETCAQPSSGLETHTGHIPDFANGLASSPFFRCGGHKWRLMFINYCSLYLLSVSRTCHMVTIRCAQVPIMWHSRMPQIDIAESACVFTGPLIFQRSSFCFKWLLGEGGALCSALCSTENPRAS